jgi:hypothetical protein
MEGVIAEAIVIARRSARRRRLIPRRPRPDLEFFFSRYERRRQGVNRSDPGSRSDLHELESQARLQNRH